jgi:hypothetical protein
LLTFVIVLPPIYVSNAFMGARHSFRQIMAEMLAALAVTSSVLASMATVAFFFALTSEQYDFVKLLHVLFFTYAGLAGLSYLIRSVKWISSAVGRATPPIIFAIWLLLYAFVGTQLARVPQLAVSLAVFRPFFRC